MLKSIVAIALSLSVISSCAQLKNVGKATAECSLKLVEGQLPGLFNKVKEVLEGGSPDWSSQLETLGLKDGIGFVVCAVQKYVQLNSTQIKTSSGVATRVSALTVADLSKAQAVLKGVQFLEKHKKSL